MLRIALTGGIACGKSTVLKLFQQQDLDRIFTLSADSLVHKLYQTGSPVYQQVVQEFGEGILTPEKKIDRGKLANAASPDPEKRKKLAAIVHPTVSQAEIDWIPRVQLEHPRGHLGAGDLPLLSQTEA